MTPIESVKKPIGNAIKQARNEAGLTQTQLAVALGHKSAAYLSFIEKGS